jgi:thioredoxin-like negative regulator of GroEL
MNNFTKNLYGNSIPELTGKNFTVNNKKVYLKGNYKENKTLIIFYAPWCKHCQNMVDNVNELQLNNMHKFTILSVNITKKSNFKLADELKISSIPKAFVLKKKNQLIPFSKQINYENLFYYINMNID